MIRACPTCQNNLRLVNMSPGRYEPVCPTCKARFCVVVPANPSGEIVVRPVGSPRPSPPQKPAATALEPKTARVKRGAPPPESIDFIVEGKQQQSTPLVEGDVFSVNGTQLGPSTPRTTLSGKPAIKLVPGSPGRPRSSPAKAPLAPRPQKPQKSPSKAKQVLVRPCPACQNNLRLVNATPGRYQPACPTCNTRFVVVVPDDPATEVSVSPVGRTPQQPPAPQPGKSASASVRPSQKSGPKTAQVKRDPPPESAEFTVGGEQQAATGDDDFSVDAAPPVGAASPPKSRSRKASSKLIARPLSQPAQVPESHDSFDDDFSIGSAEAPPPVEDEQDEAELPDRLGGYEVLKQLGKGGMGAVLLGRQISLGRNVALKVMHPQFTRDPDLVARFAREAYAAAQICHHNVVQIYDIGEDAGQPFFSMEFVPGSSLADLVKKKGKLAAELAVSYTLQAARGLRYGHKQGMVHRDVKPANLLINDEGVVKVADLGLVKLPTQGCEPATPNVSGPDSGHAELTQAGTAVGSPAYMAPEQAVNSSAVDHRADIYSLGCTLYVLLTGKPPFEGQSIPEVLTKHQTEPVTPPEAHVKRLPPALSSIVLTMLAKDPADRYQSMDELIATLEGFLGVERTGPFNPAEDQADQLEKCAEAFHAASTARRKGLAVVGFAVVCAAGILAAGASGRFTLAAWFLGLALTAPLAGFVTQGLMTGGVVFTRCRAWLFGIRVVDGLFGIAAAALLLSILYLFGLLGVGLAAAAGAALFALVFVGITDRPQTAARTKLLEEARRLLRKLRLQGVGEDEIRHFVCKFSGPNWEEFFETLFGYEAMLAARAYRKGNTGEKARHHAAWREPIVAWIDAQLESRRLAREERHLHKVQARALRARGVSAAEASTQAAEMANNLVDWAAHARTARRAGKEVELKGLMAAARGRGKPARPPMITRAKRKLDRLLDDWLGSRLRFAAGMAFLAAGVLWMHQNHLLSPENPVYQSALGLQFEEAARGLTQPLGDPLKLSILPPIVAEQVHSHQVPLLGLALLASAVLFSGWRSTLPAAAGVLVGLAGASLGIPDLGPLHSSQVGFAAAILLMLLGGRVLRR